MLLGVGRWHQRLAAISADIGNAPLGVLDVGFALGFVQAHNAAAIGLTLQWPGSLQLQPLLVQQLALGLARFGLLLRLTPGCGLAAALGLGFINAAQVVLLCLHCGGI